MLALLLLGAGLAIALGALYAFLALRRRRRRRVPGPLRYPVVLVHGVLGFDELAIAGRRREYFSGVAERLRGLGTEVVAVRLPPLGSTKVRAEALARLVRELDAKRVNLIAHSMGGIDCRFAISRLGLAGKVASLTTVGTPHRGTPIADLGTSVLGETLGLRRLAKVLALDVGAFYDLTVQRMQTFNDENPDARGVDYISVVGALAGAPSGLHPLLLPSYLYLARCAGENDGLVPASSQAWGDVVGRYPVDHWAQIGWSRGYDAAPIYGALMGELRGRGL